MGFLYRSDIFSRTHFSFIFFSTFTSVYLLTAFFFPFPYYYFHITVKHIFPSIYLFNLSLAFISISSPVSRPSFFISVFILFYCFSLHSLQQFLSSPNLISFCPSASFFLSSHLSSFRLSIYSSVTPLLPPFLSPSLCPSHSHFLLNLHFFFLLYRFFTSFPDFLFTFVSSLLLSFFLFLFLLSFFYPFRRSLPPSFAS